MTEQKLFLSSEQIEERIKKVMNEILEYKYVSFEHINWVFENIINQRKAEEGYMRNKNNFR